MITNTNMAKGFEMKQLRNAIKDSIAEDGCHDLNELVEAIFEDFGAKHSRKVIRSLAKQYLNEYFS